MAIQEIRWTRLRGVGLATDCPPGQVYDYTLAMCRPAIGDDPGAANVQKIAIGGFVLIALLGIAGAVTTTYIVWRVAKKQRWV